MVELVGKGSALVIATVGADGDPYAGRGWGADVIAPSRVRVIVDGRDSGTIENLAAKSAVAITATDVPTLRSLQFKGRSLGLQAGGPEDRLRADRYCEAFFNDVARTDGLAIRLLRRLVPEEYVVCEIDVTELYDQTPGPGAGRPFGTSASG